MNVLIPSVGRKRYLVRAFDAALQACGGQLYVSDVDDNAPALFEGGLRVALPRFDDARYWLVAAQVIEERLIDAVIPVRDAELLGWAECAAAGDMPVEVLLSNVDALVNCSDKTLLYEHAARVSVSSPPWIHFREIGNADPPFGFPAVLKPNRGSGSRGVRRIDDAQELRLFEIDDGQQDLLLQQWVEGPEFSVDSYVLKNGVAAATCVRRRSVVRNGECIAGEVTNSPALIDASRRLIDALSFRGVVNMQFIDSDQGLLLIDVNPRFPGGVRLTVDAGFDMIGATVAELYGEPFDPARWRLGAS